MDRRKQEASACVVCGIRDARLLTRVAIGAEDATLCGSHALLLDRSGRTARTVKELRAALGERRSHDRRAGGGDELAERLAAAFTRDRRAG